MLLYVSQPSIGIIGVNVNIFEQWVVREEGGSGADHETYSIATGDGKYLCSVGPVNIRILSYSSQIHHQPLQ